MATKLKHYSTLGTNDKEAAENFYNELLSLINAIKFPANDRITMWLSPDDNSVILAIAVPYNGEQASSGNGTMKGIALDSKEEVDAMYAKAISLGAKDDGEPGQRAGAFYGAYVYDLDGNKLTFLISTHKFFMISRHLS